MMHRNKSVDVHQFAMVPRADIPRSAFRIESAHKTTFDAGYIVPVYLAEVLPGDSVKMEATFFARLSTPLYPIMDNLRLDSFWFFVPNRLVWEHWQQFMGQQANPSDSISYTVPQIVSKASGYDANTIFDYLGLPTFGQVTAAATVSHSALPLRAYNLIWNEWFRDENLQNSVTFNRSDGPDVYTDYALLRRGKRHDYFTGALPWPQKGNTSVSVPLGTSAPIVGLGITTGTANAATGAAAIGSDGNAIAIGTRVYNTNSAAMFVTDADNSAGNSGGTHFPKIYADLSQATAATINQLRQSFQIQKLLERDARGGTRYTEILRAHFGVTSPDARLQRPEYLGGGSQPVVINPVTQNTQTGLTGGTSPMGTLAGVGTSLGRSGFTQSFTEHGYVFGFVSVRADLSYQQGLERHWSRSTRYDYYFPAFAMLGEQSILNKEIYVTGGATDSQVFGYQERWAEYRYKPSQITGQFRSTYATPLDAWHLAQKFTALPTLNSTFIQDTPPVSRVVAVGASANGQQFIFDSFYKARWVRPMPMYSVPGLIDHF